MKKYGNLWNLSLYYCCTVILYHRKSCGSPMWSIHFIYQLQYFPWLFSNFDCRSQCFVHILQISLCHQFTRWHIHSRTYWLKKILYYAVEVLQFTLKVTTFWKVIMLYIEYLVLSVKPTNIILKESKIKNFISEFVFFLCLFVFYFLPF